MHLNLFYEETAGVEQKRSVCSGFTRINVSNNSNIFDNEHGVNTSHNFSYYQR